MSEYELEVEPVGPEHGEYVLLITPYTAEDEEMHAAVVAAEGEAAIDDAFKVAFEGRAFERYGSRQAFEEHVLTNYRNSDAEWEWAQSDQLVVTGPKDVIEELSAQMEPESFIHYVMDQQGFTEYALSIAGPDEGDDVEISLGSDEKVLVVTPYSPEMSTRMQMAGMDGEAHNPRVRAAFSAEALEKDPDFEKFRDTVSECVVRNGLTIRFGGNDFIVLSGDEAKLEAAEFELEE